MKIITVGDYWFKVAEDFADKTRDKLDLAFQKVTDGGSMVDFKAFALTHDAKFMGEAGFK